MLTEKQMKSIPPKPFEPVFHIHRKKVKTVFGYRVIEEQIPVMVYDPQTGKKVQKMQRGTWSKHELNRRFPNQMRNKKLSELFG